MKIIGWITTFVVTIALSTLWSGYVLSKFWSWFMVPGLGLPALTTGYAIGVALVIRYLVKETSSSNTKDKRFSEILVEGIVTALLTPTIALGFGALVAAFL